MKTTTTLHAIGISLALSVSGFSQTTFTKITTGPIATDRGTFGGAAWGDFYNHGLLDLFACDYAGGTNVYYRNNGDGTFVKITQGDPVQRPLSQVAPTAVDFDNDGYLDLSVSGVPTAQSRYILYHNSGDGTFSPVSGGGVTNILGYWNACADYDNDGFVDLFIPGQNGTSGVLFHNSGDGTFSRIVSGRVVSDGADSSSVSWADYDNDGFMDLLVMNTASVGRNFLYHNDRDGTFTRVLTNIVATDTWFDGSWGGAWGDYDNDGLLDLFVPCMNAGNRLYHNNGNGVFTNVASGPMLARPPGGGSRACTWGDYDNDGYLDLFVCGYNATNRLFRNNGNGTFTQILSGPPVDEPGTAITCHGCASADYDNDGFLDLFVTRATDSGSPISNLLYHNNGNTNSWLEVRLAGRASNRSAIGAKVHARATIGGKSFWQLREISSSGGGRWSQPLVAHFGLGDATNVDTLRIEWPSGIVQTLTNVAARQVLTVVEHQAVGVVTPPSFTSVSRSVNGAVNLSVVGDAGLLYLFEASTNLANWVKVGVGSNATLSFTDTKATNYTCRFYRASIP